jgi:ferredoxin
MQNQKMAKIIVRVDADLCIAAGACIDTAPKFFVLDDENRANVIGPAPSSAFEQELDVTPAEYEAIQAAVQGCPTSAISIKG